jgi:heme-degrading monooxygenase HmoA
VSTESPILVDLWTVDPSRRDELIRAISSAMQSIVVGQPGFISAQIYGSVDGGAVLLSVSMRTAKERQHLTDSPEAHRALRELRAIANSHARLFQLVESFGMGSHPDPRSTI